MKILLSWLKNYIPLEVSVEEISQTLTNIGLEVEEVKQINTIKGGLEGLLVGHVLSAIQHPNADRLRITQVDIGAEKTLQIVCGAPNVAAGQKVIIAPVGTFVHPIVGEAFQIKSSKIRGEVSEGMICAQDEIGLGSDHDGIMVLDAVAKIGSLISKHLNLENDFVVEIGLTPNRIDAASHIGVAKDLAAFYRSEISLPSIKVQFPSENKLKPFDVEVLDADAAPRYCTLLIENVKVAPSPDWLQKSLIGIGLQPINNIVDITNFVLHETGQPLHAFDQSKIKGNKIIVRKAVQNSEFQTLDGITRKMSSDDLMICDQENMMCIAGVYGGKNSGVSNQTNAIVLESAFFNPISVRKTSRFHQLKTDSSFRFERKTDIDNTIYAIKRAADLICEIASGKIASSISDFYPVVQNAAEVTLSRKYLDTLIGQHISQKEVNEILIGLGFTILSESEQEWKLKIPTAKTDVLREADVVEEILRIYGYDNIKISGKLSASLSANPKPNREKFVQRIADQLSDLGFLEIMNLSFSPTSSNEKSIPLLNPLSADLAIMRTELLNGALNTILYNQNRRQAIPSLFEIGKVYEKGFKTYLEKNQFLILIPENTSTHWQGNKKNDFFTVKGLIENLLQKAGIRHWESKESEFDGLNSSLSFKIGKSELAIFGEVKNTVLKEKGIDQKIFAAILHSDELLKALQGNLKFKEIAKFPSVKRDLSILVKEEVSFDQLKTIALQTGKKLLKEVQIFDVYKNDPKATIKKLPEGTKSYALSFVLEDVEKTLTESEIDGLMNKLITNLEKQLGAEIRRS